MNFHGLTIGINDFPGTQNDLAGCVNDAQDMRRLLQRSVTPIRDGISDTPFFHNFDSVTTLLDKQATRKNAIQAVGTLLSKLSDGDFGYLWFSQHGSFVKDTNSDEPDGEDEVLVFADFGLWVDDDICRMLSSRNPKSLIFIGTDACHSGTVHRMYIPQDRTPQSRVRYLPADQFPLHARPEAAAIRDPKPIEKMAKTDAPLPNVVHFAGCQDTEFCYDAHFKGKPNGAFTYYLLKALGTLKPGATFGDWFNAVCKFLPSVEYSQNPRCNATPDCLAWPLPVRKV